MNIQTSPTLSIFAVTDLLTGKAYRIAARNATEALSIAKYKHTVCYAEVAAYRHNINKYNAVREVC